MDANGEPTVVYYGADREFFSFNHDRVKRNGLYFTKDKDAAKRFNGGGDIIDAFLNIRVPLYKDYAPIISKKTANSADGIIVDKISLDEEVPTYIVLSPNQIKSATDNTGSFSSTTNDIRYRNTSENKKSRSSLGDTINENPLNGSVSKPEGVSFSKVNVAKNTTKIKQKIKNAKNKGLSVLLKDVTNKNIYSTLGRILYLRNHSGSWYNEFETPKGTMTLRLSHHKANGSNFGLNKSAVNNSIVIEKHVRDSDKGSVEYSEYVYSQEDLDNNPVQVVESILNGALSALGTGEFVDESGLAQVSHYNNNVRYSKQPSLSETTFVKQKQMKKHADALASKLGVSVNYANKSELPTKHKKAKGKFDVNTGVVTIYLDNNNDLADIESAFLHEVVAHKGVRDLFGDQYSGFIMNIYKSLDVDTKAEVNSLAAKRGFDLSVAMDEYLAELAEKGVRDPTLWQRVKEAFVDMLNKVGISLKREIRDADLRYILWKSYKNLQGKKSLLDVAEDIVVSNRFRTEEEQEDGRSKQINERFNRELKAQIEGALPKGHIYSLGKPSVVLQSAGVPLLHIELAASILNAKADVSYKNSHPFRLSDVVDLPNAINNPIAVFDSKTRGDSKVLLTELVSNNVNFIVALQISKQKGSIEINDIRSLYPKDNIKDVVSWINRGDLLLYADKDKILEWITQQRSNSAEVAIPNKDFNVATNIIQKFENPKTETRYRDGGDYVGSAKEFYNEALEEKANKIRQDFMDEKLSLKITQIGIERETGEPIADHENVHLHDNHKAGKSTEEMKAFERNCFNPIVDEVGEIMNNGASYEDVLVYIEAKHGLERNGSRICSIDRCKSRYYTILKILSNNKMQYQ